MNNAAYNYPKEANMHQSLQRTIEMIEDNDSHPFVKHAVSALGMDLETLEQNESDFRYQDRLYNLTQIANYLIENNMEISTRAAKPKKRRRSLDFTIRGPCLSVPYTPVELHSYKLEVERKKLGHKLVVAKNRKKIQKSREKHIEQLKAYLDKKEMKKAPLKVFDSKVDEKIEAIRQKTSKETHERETKALNAKSNLSTKKIDRVVSTSPHKRRSARSESESRARENKRELEKLQEQREILLFNGIRESYEKSKERREECNKKEKSKISSRNNQWAERLSKMNSTLTHTQESSNKKIDLVRKNIQSEYSKKSEEIADKIRKRFQERNSKLEKQKKERLDFKQSIIQKHRAHQDQVNTLRNNAEALARDKAKLREEYNEQLKLI